MINNLKGNGQGYKNNSRAFNVIIQNKNGGINMETKLMKSEQGQVLYQAYIKKNEKNEKNENEISLLMAINGALEEKHHYQNVFRAAYNVLNMETRIKEHVFFLIAGPIITSTNIAIYEKEITRIYGEGFTLDSISVSLAKKELTTGLYSWEYGKENMELFKKGYFIVFFGREINKVGVHKNNMEKL